jgi:hypothetical protein
MESSEGGRDLPLKERGKRIANVRESCPTDYCCFLTVCGRHVYNVNRKRNDVTAIFLSALYAQNAV